MRYRLIGLPREESRCLLQDLPLLLEDPHLPAQPAQLLPLLRHQALTLAAIDLCLTRPAPQPLSRDPELARDLHDRLAARAYEPHRLLAELRRTRRSRPRHLALRSGLGSPSV